MLNPYRARVDERAFLNLPGFHGGAHVVAYVEDTAGRVVLAGDENPEPRLILEIADCSNRINLEFDIYSATQRMNSFHKLDTLIGALAAFRAGLVEECRLFTERERAAERG
jgi:hypothetical protein